MELTSNSNFSKGFCSSEGGGAVPSGGGYKSVWGSPISDVPAGCSAVSPMFSVAHCERLSALLSSDKPFCTASNRSWCGCLSERQQRPCQWTIPRDLANS